MVFILSAVLFICAVLFVGYPLYRHERTGGKGGEDAQQLDGQRSAIRSLLEELELDYEMGNISQSEYEVLESNYRNQLGNIAESSDEFEVCVTGTLEEAIEVEIMNLRQYKPIMCPQCGTPQPAKDRFCPQCGKEFFFPG